MGERRVSGDPAERSATDGSAGRLEVVIVNYRTGPLVIECLASLAPEVDTVPGTRVVVVDNVSGDGSAEQIEAAIRARGWARWARLHRSPRNGGFSYGNNQALRPRLMSRTLPDYVLLLNPDTTARPGALAGLVAFMDRRPDAGVAGARVLDPDGSVRRSAFRFHSALGELLAGARLGPLSRLLEPWVVAPPPRDEVHLTDWVSGACMIVRREALETVGLMDEGYFLYYEEMDLCRRARDAAWACYYAPVADVVHLCGQSLGATPEERRRGPAPAYRFVSRRRYFRKHHGPLYARLADVAWALGFASFRVRQALQRKPEEDPPRLWRDFVRHIFLRPDPAADAPPTEALEPAPGAPPPLPRGARDENPPGIPLAWLLLEDLRTHDMNLLEPGFWAVAVHRLGNWRMNVRPRPLRAPLSLAYQATSRLVNWTWGIKLDYTVKLGRRVRIWHHGGMILGARSIGDDVHLRQNTTLGVVRRGQNAGKPVIGDRVDVGAGACILGPVEVGHDAVVGANAVVLRDVPPGAVVGGVPARVLRSRFRDSRQAALPEAPLCAPVAASG